MVQDLVKEGAAEALRKCFASRMEFGTAGLRAAMGAGVSCMNDLTVIQTTQVSQRARCSSSHAHPHVHHSLLPLLFGSSRCSRMTAPVHMHLPEPVGFQGGWGWGGAVCAACPPLQVHFLFLHLFVLPDRVSVATWRSVLGALKSEGWWLATMPGPTPPAGAAASALPTWQQPSSSAEGCLSTCSLVSPRHPSW